MHSQSANFEKFKLNSLNLSPFLGLNPGEEEWKEKANLTLIDLLQPHSWPKDIDPVWTGYIKKGVSLQILSREQPHLWQQPKDLVYPR